MKLITYGNYVWAPVISALMWLGTLLGLLLWWAVEDKARTYGPEEPTIVYISDSGAAHKALFVAGTAITSTFYVLSLILERWLRHVDRLPTNVHKRERICDGLAIVFGIIGALALFFLSVFDAFNHSTVHWSLTVVFIVGVAISAICQTAEIHYLEAAHPDRNHLRRNAWIKIFIVSCAVGVAIAFGVLYSRCGGDAGPTRAPSCDKTSSAAAVCEWVVAFIFLLYLCTLVLDLYPAAKTSPRHQRRHERHLQEKQTANDSLTAPQPAWTSQNRPSQETYNSRTPIV